MVRVTIDVAETQLSKLIRRAQTGEEIVIVRGKEPVAQLVPVAGAGPKLREIDDDELEAQLKKHKVWLESVEDESDEALEQRLRIYMERSTWDMRPGANLQSTKPPGEKFRTADLRWANFRRAGLQNADFRLADLRGTLFFNADLREADLGGADLARADLSGADLRKANLLRANLREANLRDADLTEVKGLLAEQLAGTNVSGAKLPEDIAKFEGLVHIEQIAKIARPVYLTMLLGCLYAFASIASTTDTALVTDAASQVLPNLQTAIPTVGFYWAAPTLLLSLYLYLHLYLQGLWEELGGLPAIFPDGRTLDQRAYPWLITSLAREFVPLLTKERRPFASLKVGISTFVAWGLVPITLIYFWARYLVLHHWSGTVWQGVLIVVAVGFGAASYRAAAATLGGKSGHDEDSALKGTKGIWAHIIRVLRAARNYRPDGWTVAAAVLTVSVSLGAIEGKPGGLKLDPRTWIPSVFRLNLQGINLKDVDLAGRDLKGANFRFAGLQRANLRTTNLRDADLGWVNLRNANLRGARLHMAFFDGARLQGADLRGAKGLTPRQLDKACGDEKTKLPDYLKDYKIKPCPEEPK